MIRRLLLWLGKITDFDRTAAKMLLFVAAINIFFVSLVVFDTWIKEPIFGDGCDEQCEAITEALENLPTRTHEEIQRDVNDIINEVIEERSRP